MPQLHWLSTSSGPLRWLFGLPAAETKRLRFRYEAKYPKDHRVVLD